ncbi:MAG: glutamine-hydrolyzing GMP synthase [Candidatus Marinimicrobia bacterium]|nr:glutamine-hydrolyzing GMP synthase [Candidatus Neomarinimicrobiota bacterium]
MDLRHNQGVVILDFGSQYTRLIARRIREQKIFSEILPSNTKVDVIRKLIPKAVILSGGPSSVYSKSAPKHDESIFNLDIPILGICYGLHLLVQHYGGKIETSNIREYGFDEIKIKNKTDLFDTIPSKTKVWMSHADKVSKLPKNWEMTAESSNGIMASLESKSKKRYATQFHPEVDHTDKGKEILSNFLFKIAKCNPTWKPDNFIIKKVEEIREIVGKSGKVLTGVSGGVDSSVVAALLNKAIGDSAISVIIDHGFMRKDEAKNCVKSLKEHLGLNVQLFDESKVFLERLKGIKNPEKKRKIIGEQFIRSFEKIARKIGQVDFLAQGTLYTDVIESGGHGNIKSAKVIKSHHNVGGLPKNMELKLIEPLKELFKDEVRNVGRELGLSEKLLNRHPFPGPGLAVRILGSITQQRIDILQEADDIYISVLQEEGIYDDIWQAFSVLIPVKTVGVMGDNRTYENLIALRAVTSLDGMTADWYRMPDNILSKISNKIVNSVSGINRVVYDVTSKPPGTIEWE